MPAVVFYTTQIFCLLKGMKYQHYFALQGAVVVGDEAGDDGVRGEDPLHPRAPVRGAGLRAHLRGGPGSGADRLDRPGEAYLPPVRQRRRTGRSTVCVCMCVCVCMHVCVFVCVRSCAIGDPVGFLLPLTCRTIM